MPHLPTPIPIVFCITELDPGGAERALFNIVTRLDRDVFDPTVISLSGTGIIGDWFRERGIKVIELKASGKYDLSAFMKLIQELKRIKPVIIQGFLFQANMQSRIAGYFANVPHRLSGIRVAERRSKLFHWLDRLTEFLVEKHVCVSHGVKEFSQQIAGLDPRKLVVIPNGVDIERLAQACPVDRAEFNLSSNDFIALSAGRLDVQKGYDFLLKTLAVWSGRPDNFKLLVAGIGTEQTALEKLIHELGLEQVVHLIGYREDFPGLLKMCDVYIQSSRYEGMCNAVLEALAASKIVITTDFEGIAELGGNHGLLPPVTFGDHADLISLIELVMAGELDDIPVDKSPQYIDINELTWDFIANKYAELYTRIMQKPV